MNDKHPYKAAGQGNFSGSSKIELQEEGAVLDILKQDCEIETESLEQRNKF